MKRDLIEDGRLSDHGRGLGTITSNMVQRRAEEIALINGRDQSQVLSADLTQARRELQGQEGLYPEPTSAEKIPEWDRWNPVASNAGHKANPQRAADEQTVAERLVEEGVAEAEHDQQVQAVREGRRQDNLS